MRQPRDYDDIPGTYVFDYDRSHQGYHLNMFCMSLLKPENREAFLADEEGYLKKYPMRHQPKRSYPSRQPCK